MAKQVSSTFHAFQRLPNELKQMDTEPARVISLEAFWSGAGGTRELLLRISLERDEFLANSPEVFELGMTAACKESRDVHLKEYPDILPLRLRGPERDRSISKISFNDKIFIYIRDLFQTTRQTHIWNALLPAIHPRHAPLVSWTHNIKRLCIPSYILGIRIMVCKKEKYRDPNAEMLVQYFNNVEELLFIAGTGHEISGDFWAHYFSSRLDEMKAQLQNISKDLGKGENGWKLQYVPWPWTGDSGGGE